MGQRVYRGVRAKAGQIVDMRDIIGINLMGLLKKVIIPLIFGIVAIAVASVTSTFSALNVLESRFVTTAVYASDIKSIKMGTACNQAKNNKAFQNIELNRATGAYSNLVNEAQSRKLTNLELQRKVQLEQDIARMISELAVLSREVAEQCK